MLLLLVEDILDLAKMEAGTFKFNLSEFSLNEIVEELNEIFIDQCKHK